MAGYFSSSFAPSAINQPKMRQEGFHLPSPSPSNGNPPSPPSATTTSTFDMYLPHSHHSSSTSPTSAGGNSNGTGPHYSGLNIPDAFSRTGGSMDFGDEIASLIASSPAASNDRATHTPPYDHHHSQGPAASSSSADPTNGYRPTHNIFDISAPPSAHYTSHNPTGPHAFSLPHTSHRSEIPPISQPSSVHTSHLHTYDHRDFHPAQHPTTLGRDGHPVNYHSTIPPLSTHYDPPVPSEQQGLNHPPSAYNNQVYSPASSGGPVRETPSPPGGGPASRPGANQRRSGSRSRSRARGSSVSATGPGSNNASSGTGPTRTTKSSSKRRDSFTLQHTGHHGHGLLHHNSGLPSPPPVSSSPAGSGTRPQAILIPPQHYGRGSVATPSSPLGMASINGVGMGGVNGIGGIGIGVGQTSGWFLTNTGSGGPVGATPGSAPSGTGAEYQLPTPDSVGHGHTFSQFGTSVGSMGISPKDTTMGAKGESPPLDAATKQAAIVNEKRRRRRESHNAVERRRRDNINEKISELATLIPEVMLNPTAQTTSLSPTDESNESKKDITSGVTCASPSDENASVADNKEPGGPGGSGPVKANKGMILRKSVEYIRYLQQLVNAQAARNRELEQKLARAGIHDDSEKDVSVAGGDLAASDVDSSLSNALNAAGVGGFPDDVLNLHTFSPDSDDMSSLMGMGFATFDPSNSMDMDADVTLGADGSYQVRRGGDHDQEGTSPSVASEEDRDEDGEHSQPPTQPRLVVAAGRRDKEVEMELESRGRRDREGRIRMQGMPGVVTVKEESHMEM